jgi:hypothetical protein
VTVIVEAPVVLTVPLQICSSLPLSVTFAACVHKFTPPPDTDEAVTLDEETLTARANRSPAFWGDTGRVVVSVPLLLPRVPTEVMVAEDAPALAACNKTPLSVAPTIRQHRTIDDQIVFAGRR